MEKKRVYPLRRGREIFLEMCEKYRTHNFANAAEEEYINMIMRATQSCCCATYDGRTPLNHTYIMLYKAEKNKCKLRLEVDPEFLSGVALEEYLKANPPETIVIDDIEIEVPSRAESRAGQNDGWTYHFELDI